jgi:hypothetical protein
MSVPLSQRSAQPLVLAALVFATEADQRRVSFGKSVSWGRPSPRRKLACQPCGYVQNVRDPTGVWDLVAALGVDEQAS